MVLALCMIIASVSMPAAAFSLDAENTNSTIFINGARVQIEGYNINGYNYFKIRDLANALHDTSSQFDVTWNAAEEQIELSTRTPYSAYAPPENSWRYYSRGSADPTTAALLVDGARKDFTAYNIEGNNYFRLRDMAEVVPFYVDWSEENNAIFITTRLSDLAFRGEYSGVGRTDGRMTVGHSTARTGAAQKSALYKHGNGFVAIDARDMIRVDSYDSNFRLTGTKELPFELELFGAFYSGERYNYIAFGQENSEENDNKEVIRIVKYDKDFNRIDSAAVRDCYTIVPFDFTASRMSESGNELVLHTARLRYLTEDGLNHQSQLTVVVDTNTMNVTNANALGRFQSNHVSHSFNQFVQFDGNAHVLVDHGDAYPRSVVVNKGAASRGYDEADLFDIAGPIGANYTGVAVGGFEVSDKNYLVAINSVNQSRLAAAWGRGSANPSSVSGAQPNNAEEFNERDIIICVIPKTFTRSTTARQISLTNYIGNQKLASAPYLVKISDGEFVALWQEFNTGDAATTDPSLLKYAKLTGAGEMIGTAQTIENAYLSADCQPIWDGGAIVWFVDDSLARTFFKLNI